METGFPVGIYRLDGSEYVLYRDYQDVAARLEKATKLLFHLQGEGFFPGDGTAEEVDGFLDGEGIQSIGHEDSVT